MDQDVITGSSPLPRLAVGCGLTAAAACTLALTHIGAHTHIGHAAMVLTIAAVTLGGLALLDRRSAERMTALYSLHCDEREAADRRHDEALERLEANHRQERQEWLDSCREERERHERDVQQYLAVVQQLAHDRATAEARGREQGRAEGRAEGERVADIQLESQRERHEAELEQAAKRALEQGQEEGFELGYRARDAEPSGQSVRHLPRH